MHFDLRLWRMTAGLRGRIALGILLGLAALAVGIARFAFLGQFLARLFRGAPPAELLLPLSGTLIAVVLRPWLDHLRTMLAHRTGGRVQERLRGRLYNKIVALGPFGLLDPAVSHLDTLGNATHCNGIRSIRTRTPGRFDQALGQRDQQRLIE